MGKDAPTAFCMGNCIAGVKLMASDTMRDGVPAGITSPLPSIAITLAEMERLFGALSAGGKVTMAMHDAFWGGRFGC